jgi:putative endonuclease
LRQQNWQILEQRWHCRWGELDLVALHLDQPCLAFVEVKARSRGNWDANGLLAITPAKQTKLGLTAQLFLADHADWANSPCRFDVAIVNYRQRRSSDLASPNRLHDIESRPVIELGQPILCGGYCLTLQHYIAGAFE